MRTILSKYIVITLLLLPFAISASEGGGLKGKYSKEKTIKKEFNVNSNALLKIKNSYGNLNITSWDQDKVVIEVHIKTSGNNEDKVISRLKEIDVDFENGNSMVSATQNMVIGIAAGDGAGAKRALLTCKSTTR